MTKKFTIDRGKWDRGRGAGASQVYLDGPCGMCCLGFVAAQCGIDAMEIEETSDPAEHAYTWRGEERWPEAIRPRTSSDGSFFDNTNLCNEIIGANDAALGTPEASFNDEPGREEKLKELFAKGGMEIEFVWAGETPTQ